MNLGERIKRFDNAFYDSGKHYKEYLDNFKKEFPDLFFLELPFTFPMRKLLDYTIRDVHKGHVQPFYSRKTLAFENEHDKTLFLLKYGQ